MATPTVSPQTVAGTFSVASAFLLMRLAAGDPQLQ